MCKGFTELRPYCAEDLEQVMTHQLFLCPALVCIHIHVCAAQSLTEDPSIWTSCPPKLACFLYRESRTTHLPDQIKSQSKHYGCVAVDNSQFWVLNVHMWCRPPPSPSPGGSRQAGGHLIFSDHSRTNWPPFLLFLQQVCLRALVTTVMMSVIWSSNRMHACMSVSDTEPHKDSSAQS